MNPFLKEFFVFLYKQAYACLFAGILLFFIIGTHWYYPFSHIARYDFLFFIALFTQIILFIFRLETPAEAKVILLFHISGTVMEIFKVHFGAWIYPEEGILKIFQVPLFSGFMYSAVGSYIARVWRIFQFSFSFFPNLYLLSAVAGCTYINFFSHHFLPDIRIFLLIIIIFLFRKSWIFFTIEKIPRKVPLLWGAFLLAFCIWIAENISTFSHIWLYPYQYESWKMVSYQKIVSWFLLMILSFVMVCWINISPKTISQKCEP